MKMIIITLCLLTYNAQAANCTKNILTRLGHGNLVFTELPNQQATLTKTFCEFKYPNENETCHEAKALYSMTPFWGLVSKLTKIQGEGPEYLTWEIDWRDLSEDCPPRQTVCGGTKHGILKQSHAILCQTQLYN